MRGQDALGRGKAVRTRHLDVHEDDVVHRLVVTDDRPAVLEIGDLERDAVFLAVAGKVVGEKLARECLVLDDGDAHHDPTLPYRSVDRYKNK